MNKHKTGMVLGTFFGLFHAVWSFMVAIDLAQPFMNWIFKLHFIQPPYTMLPFAFWTALGLVVVTFIVGYICGWVFAGVWNWLQPKQ